MNIPRPDFLDSKYIALNEDGEYVCLPGAPAWLCEALAEYLEAARDGFLEPDDLPDLPPM